MTQELHGVISLGGTVIGGSLNQRGLKGETGNGIESVVMTEEYNLVITYTDGDVVTLDTGLDDYEELLKGYKDDAESAKSDAESAKTDAVDAKNDAVSAKNDALSAKNDAVSAKNGAESAKSDAVSAKNDAVSAKTDAQSAKTAAETAQGKAESSASDSEAYAVGTRGGTPVSSGDVAYENNSKYMKEQAAIYTLQADSYAGESELWATGELDGTPVGNTYPQYENNSKYYAGEASSSAASAGGSASSAETESLKSEGFAVGEQNGTPVTSGSPYYHNNAKYYSEQFIRAFPTDTASGAIASFPDGSDLFDYLSCIVNIEPVQDLHGYDKPWVVGAGKNKANLADGTRTGQGITGTVSNQVISASGTATTTFANINYFNAISITSGQTYTVMLSKSVSNGITFRFATDTTDTTYQQVNIASGATSATFTANNNFTVFRLYVAGLTVGDAVNISGLQVLVGAGSIQTFEPYENLCPITGWTGCEVVQTGHNLIKVSAESYDNSQACTYTVTDSGVTVTATGNYARRMDAFAVKTGQTYTLSFTGKSTGNNNAVYLCKSTDWNYRYGLKILTSTEAQYAYTFTADTDVFALGWYVTSNSSSGEMTITDLQLELGSTATPYTSYNGTTYPVSWQTEAGTVYGGTLDLMTGVLTVTMAMVDAGTLTWSYNSSYGFISTSLSGVIKNAPSFSTKANIVCSIYETGTYSDIVGAAVNNQIGVSGGSYGYVVVRDTRFTDAQSFMQSMSGAQLVYELATPTTYQLDPVQVACLLGQNNVWADCGDIEEVKYKADVQKWVEKQLREINTAILALS